MAVLLTVLVYKLNQFGNDLLQRSVLVLLRSLLVRVVLVMFGLAAASRLRLTDLRHQAFSLEPLFCLERQLLVEHKNHFAVESVHDLEDSLCRDVFWGEILAHVDR